LRSAARLTDALRGHGKALIYLGTAAALAGAGTASAAALISSSPAQPAAAVSHHAVTRHAVGRAPAHQEAKHAVADHAAAHHAVPYHVISHHDMTHHVVAHHATMAKHAVAHHAQARPVAKHATARASIADLPWSKVRIIAARQADPRLRPGSLPLAYRLKTGPASGPQAFMPITRARMANATTIVRQVMDKHMGVRSAVIAVATAMQESSLLNIDYGDRDSLGLFQQRPSMGWGTPAQVTDPTYASDAFLNALRSYQAHDRGWASQPLWQAAQGVQNSGFPYAYAKWEDQAAHIVAIATTHLL
jgi:hypothetical protein